MLAIWDAHTGAIDTAMAVANVGVSALAFAHNGRYLIAGSADGAAVIVEMETFKVLCRLDENASGLNDVYFETGITDLSELHCVTVCSRQAVSVELRVAAYKGQQRGPAAALLNSVQQAGAEWCIMHRLYGWSVCGEGQEGGSRAECCAFQDKQHAPE